MRIRVTGIILTFFWLVMTGLLLYREFIEPRFFLATARGKGERISFRLPFRQEWMGIYYKDKKVGFSYTTVSPHIFEDEEGYNIANRTKLFLAMAGEEYNLNLEGFSFVDNSYRFKRFELKVSCGEYRIGLKGEVRGDKLSVYVNSGSDTFHKEIEVDEDILLANTLTPFYVLPSLYPGRRFIVNIIDPLTLSLGKAEIKIGEKERYIFQGGVREVMPVEVMYQGISSRALITEEGELLREETPLGWVMVKETREEALRWSEEKKENVDIAYAVAIPVKEGLPEPKKIKELRLRISGIDLKNFNNSRQEVVDEKGGIVIIRREGIKGYAGKIDAGYTESDPFIQADDRDIRNAALSIVAGESDRLGMVKRLNEWVYKNIKKQPALSIPSAVEVLKLKSGDCNEHTILFTALSRSLGIPTKVCVGLVYLKGYFFYHAWPEAFVGEWVAVDPTLGEEIADATHIKIAEGGIESQIDIARVIGNIDIEVLGYEYDKDN